MSFNRPVTDESSSAIKTPKIIRTVDIPKICRAEKRIWLPLFPVNLLPVLSMTWISIMIMKKKFYRFYSLRAKYYA